MFQIPAALVEDTLCLQKHFVELNTETLESFVFVSAASSNHFNEIKDAIASVQKQFPEKLIYIHDLGLKDEQVKEVVYFTSIISVFI